MDSLKKRLVLSRSSSRHDVITALTDSQWKYERTITEDSEKNVPFEIVFSAQDRRAYLHYVEDLVMETSYIVASGPETGFAVDWANRQLPIVPDEDVLRMFHEAKGPADVANAVRLVAIAAPPHYEERFHSALLAALRHGNPGVRVYAIRACAYVGWPELRPALLNVRATDVDDRVREQAGHMLAVYSEFGING